MRHLKKWTRPDHYAGADWPEWFVFLGRDRESDALTRSNFECGLARLGGESDTVQVVREKHWAVGWVEWVAVHEADAARLTAADDMLTALHAYPVLDDDHFSDLEWVEVGEAWAGLSVRERVDLCREAGVSIFAARHDYPPADDSGYIHETLRG